MTTYLKEDFLYDADLVLEDSLDTNGDAAAITSSAAGSVLEVAQVIDLGDGLVEGYMIVDVDAIAAVVDALYIVTLQGSNVSPFATATTYDLAQVNIGAGESLFNATAGNDAGSAGSRLIVPFRNEQDGTVYRYVRVYQTLSGSSDTPSITDTIWLSIKRK